MSRSTTERDEAAWDAATAPQMTRRDLAEAAGFDPQPGDGDQPVGPWTSSPRIARHEHDTSRYGCRSCGVRCDVCDERMCSEFGPEPAARCDAHPTCVDCAEIPPCRDCGEVIRQAHEGSDW